MSGNMILWSILAVENSRSRVPGAAGTGFPAARIAGVVRSRRTLRFVEPTRAEILVWSRTLGYTGERRAWFGHRLVLRCLSRLIPFWPRLEEEVVEEVPKKKKKKQAAEEE